MAAEPAEPLAPAAVQQSTQSGGPVRVPQCAQKGWTARLRATRRRSLAEVPATRSACVGRGLPISRSRLTAACGQPDCRGHCRRHRRLAAAASSREHLKQLATVSAKALPARCAPRPMRSPARGAATASTSGSRRPLASVSSPLPVMPTQHNWKSIQGLVRNDGVELLSGRCELCAEAAVARGSVSRKFSPSGMPVAKCRTGCDVCKVHICQKCYRAGLFESYAHPGDCSGLGSSSVMMD